VRRGTTEIAQGIVAGQSAIDAGSDARRRGERLMVQDVRHQPMLDQEDGPGTGSTRLWSGEGLATFEVTGNDAPSTLEAGLRAVLSLAVAPVVDPPDYGRSTPIRGEGDELASLFADMVDDLLGQIESYGAGLHDVVVDGVLRRDGGGYVGWGYASGTLEPAALFEVPRLLGRPELTDSGSQGIVLRASLQRP